MSLAALLADLPDALLRFLPRRGRRGLVALGDPGPDAPVLLTCDYALTVRRLRRALRGRDAWLLVADAHGINVWCAAAGGHLGNAQVIQAIEGSSLAERVTHRRLVAPPLMAAGVERREVERATGWKIVWGPVRLEDLPTWLDGGSAPRVLGFTLRDRLDMALAWGFPLALVLGGGIGCLLGWAAGIALATGLFTACLALFTAIPRTPIVGPARWLTGLWSGALAAGLALGLVASLGATLTFSLAAWLAGLALAGMLAVAADAAGTTPVANGSFLHLPREGRLALDAACCVGCGECAQVCPRGVLAVEGPQARIAASEACIACAACAMQCPEGALSFALHAGGSLDAAALRATRTTLMGRRVPHGR
ncbi:MAG: HgcAB-like fusion protein [Pseudomonadota bacterium]